MKFPSLDHPYFKKVVKRLNGDSGVAMLYTAVISLFILSVFSLVFDVARVSEEKMQMQNAADAAALEFATWQARGMNVVQNLNQEIYNIDSMVITMHMTGAVLTYIAQPLKPVFGIGFAVELAGAGFIYGGLYLHHVVVEVFVKSLRHFYVYGTNVMGYLGANEIAKLNGADPVITLPGGGGIGGGTHPILGNILSGLRDAANQVLSEVRVICIPTSFDSMAKLPLKSTAAHNWPLNTDPLASLNSIREKFADIASDIDQIKAPEQSDDDPPKTEEEKKAEQEVRDNGDALSDLTDKIWQINSENLGEGVDNIVDAALNTGLAALMQPAITINTFVLFKHWNAYTWTDDYYASIYNEAGRTSLPPVIAIVKKKGDLGLLSKYLLKNNMDVPIMAYGVAQCQGGNVTARQGAGDFKRFNDSKNYGVGASAVLVPFREISKHWKDYSGESGATEPIFNVLNEILLH